MHALPLFFSCGFTARVGIRAKREPFLILNDKYAVETQGDLHLIASVIREFAVSRTPQLIAAAYFEKTIQIWNPLTQEIISEIHTIYSFGARNLALSPDA